MKFSFLKLFFLLLFSISATSLSAQSNIYIYGKGGVNYVPMKNFSHFINQFYNDKIDEIGFNGGFGVIYSFNENHAFTVGAEILSKNASYAGGFGGARWNFRVIPVLAGYKYLFLRDQNLIRPFAGFNLSYNFIEIDENRYSDCCPGLIDDFTKRNKFGFDVNTGATFQLTEKFFLLSELKYIFLTDISFWNKDVNLSGISLSVGIQIRVI